MDYCGQLAISSEKRKIVTSENTHRPPQSMLFPSYAASAGRAGTLAKRRMGRSAPGARQPLYGTCFAVGGWVMQIVLPRAILFFAGPTSPGFLLYWPVPSRWVFMT